MRPIKWMDPREWDPTALVLLAIVIAAFGLRIWGIQFGLPYIFHNDEGFEIVRALRLGTGEYDFTRIGKGGYFYLLFVEYAVLFVAFLALGIVESPLEFGELYIRDPSAFYLVGRATTAIIGTATVYLLYRVGRLAYSHTAAILGAVLLTVNVLHADLSHLTTVDVPVTFLCTITIYFAIKIADEGRTKDYWFAAILAALATSTKMPAALVLVPLLISHGSYTRQSGGAVRQYFADKRLWQSAGLFIGVYVVATPGILLYYDDVFLNAVSKFLPGVDSGATPVEAVTDEPVSVAKTNLFVFYLQILVKSMTWPVFAVCVAGLVYALWKRSFADLILASFPIIVYVTMASSTDTHLYFPRYLLPAIPCLAVLGGRFLVDVFSSIAPGKEKIALGALVCAMAVTPTMHIVADNMLLTGKDTRAEAREWVDSNIDEGAKIVIEGHRTTLSKATVPLQNSAENLRSSIEYYRDREPGKARYFKMALKVLSGKTYDLVGVGPDELQPLEQYKAAGVQYFVLRPASYEGSRLKFAWQDLVDEIRRDPDVQMIKRFEPVPRKQPGPLIEIYRVSSNVEPERSED